MTSVASKLAFAQSLPQGGALTAKEPLQFGSREAVDKALSGVLNPGKIPRIGTRLSTSPISSSYGQGSPKIGKVIDDITMRIVEVRAPRRIVSANRIRLTTHDRLRRFCLTSSKSPILSFRRRVVEFRNAPALQLIEPYSILGQVIRVINWMGRTPADWVVEKVEQILNSEQHRTLLAHRLQGPQWIAKEISRHVQ